jgi:hypothetical protein
MNPCPPASFPHDADPATVPELRASGNRSGDLWLTPLAGGIDFPSRAGQTRARSFKAAPDDQRTSLFCIQRAAPYQADCVERKEGIMVRFVRLLAAAALAAALASAANAQGVPIEEGPLDTGPLQSGPVHATPQKAKPRQTALKKRAKHAAAAPAGRDITVHARPSYLTAGTQVPVGSVGNGYVYDTFNQSTPIEGTFTGMRGRERLTDQFGGAAAGWTLFKF